MLNKLIKKLIMPVVLAALLVLGPAGQAVMADDSLPPQVSAGTDTPTAEEADAGHTSEPSAVPSIEPTYEPSAEPGTTPGANGSLQAMLAKGDSFLTVGGHEPYLQGYSGALFKPKNTMTRAEACQMLYNLLKDKPTETSSDFSDIKSGQWYEPAVSAMCTLGIVDDSDGGAYGPKTEITRAEFVVMLSRCMPLEPAESTFTDVPEDHEAYAAISAAQAAGWINGYSDGSFKPDNSIQRCEVVKVMNLALERTGDGYAADRDKQKFKDVSKNFWAFLDITEAADPPEAPEPTPTPEPSPSNGADPTPPPSQTGGYQVGDTVKVTAATGLNIRQAPVDGAVLTAVINGTLLTVTDVSKYPWLGVKTSGGVSGYSSSEFLEPYTETSPPPNTTGNGTVSATSLTVRQYRSVRLDASTTGSISSMTWTSTNPDVAKVGYTINYNTKEQSAIVYAGSPGTATLSFKDGSGSVKASCTVTVTAPEPVRFAYAEGNIVSMGRDFDLVAITDPSRDEVRFEITDGPARGTYTSSSYTEESTESKNGLPSNDIRVFRRTVRFGATGVYTVKAYSSQNGVYSSEAYTFTVQVIAAMDFTTATYDSRRMSGKGIEMLAGFEGHVQEVEEDNAVGGNPTVGYGYVVSKNQAFYNNMSKTEAYAMLVNTVNKESYATTVENFRSKYNIKMNQAQFDALTSFVYNCGPNALNVNSYDTPNIILNMVVPPTDAAPSNPYHGTQTSSESKPIYSQPDHTSATVVSVPEGGSLTVVGTKININRSTQQEVWYRVTYGNKTGWMPAGYVKLSGNVTIDLTYADSTSFANELLQWHKGAGRHWPGLLYRRLCECKVFFFSNYDEGIDKYNTTYTVNRYGFLYPSCCRNLDKRP